jgi:uncharacterized protein (DUF1501 family)
MNRRRFLRAAASIPALTLLPLGRSGWAARLSEQASTKRLVVVFLRGAVDGLNVIIPRTESAYYDRRPNIAVPERDTLVLDDRFGMHPALAALLPLWKHQRLAFVHACGSPDATRSHFDAQDYMESGTPGKKSTADGWMNRLLAQLPGRHPSTEAVSFGPTLPRIVEGKLSVANIPVGKQAGRPMAIDRPVISDAFDRMYRGNDALSVAYREGKKAHQRLVAMLEQDMTQSSGNAPSALGFAGIAEQAGRVLARDPNVRLAFLAVGGWDTHINQGAAEGQLANHLRPLGEGLAKLAGMLGPRLGDTAIVVLSEFGRTASENGNGGTDHGHGNVMWVLGGGVRGGKVHGHWPGLAPENLYEGRDLAVTTDFRDVVGALLARHMNLGATQLAAVFPGFKFAPNPPALFGA